MSLITDIKQAQCNHENYGILLVDDLPAKKYCMDCKKQWVKTPVMKGVKELANAAVL